MLNVSIIETSGLGDRSYRERQRGRRRRRSPARHRLVLTAAGDLRITHVLETHIHNDYVTGGLALAERLAPNT